MQFIYSSEASNETLKVDGDIYKYLFKVRREKIGSTIYFRNLVDSYIYKYEIFDITKKDATLRLLEKEEKSLESNKKFHLIWAIVDPKTIEKQLPYLNEIGVDKITFFYADYSQKNFKLNLEKFEKILINSSQQCGRSSIIKLEILNSLSEVIKIYDDAFIFNFSENYIDNNKEIRRIIVGCEGGFSSNELENFSSEKIVGINSNLILRSETAVTVVAAKLLL
ncbi:MAG: 16S rRNA (uracil(1498)-N(3))-methyltransferase [Arcobacter sp.]|uniref:16S rRNA (uracil(1498)-N(3))-methyltransferase n=1 Tax=uncultured Arcobacter sp. TaxID=165434 RepID=UPI000CAB92BF|nr:16S rRNA (uracil(1498)-N(3))-methyltransferase [uncultured Arcobacter sp.]PLY09559.1 MAG: 16S rRNA (uracil(1498)-N(3))-methyltransferase [Arcobacter sp.]